MLNRLSHPEAPNARKTYLNIYHQTLEMAFKHLSSSETIKKRNLMRKLSKTKKGTTWQGVGCGCTLEALSSPRGRLPSEGSGALAPPQTWRGMLTLVRNPPKDKTSPSLYSRRT